MSILLKIKIHITSNHKRVHGDVTKREMMAVFVEIQLAVT